jgi:hypothetical protein
VISLAGPSAPTRESSRAVAPLSRCTSPDGHAPAKFLAHADSWQVEAFDLIVDLVRQLDDPHCWLADVRFRIEDAPYDWLTDGADFELYEGKKCVARGQIEGR